MNRSGIKLPFTFPVLLYILAEKHDLEEYISQGYNFCSMSSQMKNRHVHTWVELSAIRILEYQR